MTWPIVPLEKLAANESASIKIGPFGSQLKKSELVSEGIHVIGIENVLGKTFDGLGDRYITQEKFESLRSVEIKPGDVLITMMGTIGEVAVAPEGIGKSIMDSHLLRFRPNKTVCFPEYVAWLLRGSENTRLALQGRAHGAIMKGLNSSIIRSLPVPLPSPSEQRRIVDILDQAMALKKKRVQGDAKETRIMPALFYKMFGDPATNSMKWDLVYLDEVVEIGTQLVDPNQPDYMDLPHIGGEEIEKNTGRILNPKTVRESKLRSDKFFFTENHILYCKIRPYLNKVAFPQFKGLCSADIYPLLPDKERVMPFFFVALLRSDAFLAYARMHSGRLRIPKLNRDQVGRYRMLLPPIDLQSIFERQVNALLAGKEKFYVAGEKLEKLFTVLLHNAFSGNLTSRWREAHMAELLVEMEHQARALRSSDAHRFDRILVAGGQAE